MDPLGFELTPASLYIIEVTEVNFSSHGVPIPDMGLILSQGTPRQWCKRANMHHEWELRFLASEYPPNLTSQTLWFQDYGTSPSQSWPLWSPKDQFVVSVLSLLFLSDISSLQQIGIKNSRAQQSVGTLNAGAEWLVLKMLKGGLSVSSDRALQTYLLAYFGQKYVL